jgi:hypothetical protein
MIKGIYADEADELHPEQWVNVYKIDVYGRAIYHSSCQVNELDLDDPEEYGLEPTDEDGNLMSVIEAFKRMKVEDVVETVEECSSFAL